MIELTEEQLKEIEEKEKIVLYLYTPLCGTCQLAKKMLTVVEAAIPSLTIYMKDLNFIPRYAEKWKVESVPCLLVIEKGEIKYKKYAFHSIEHLYESLKPYAA